MRQARTRACAFLFVAALVVGGTPVAEARLGGSVDTVEADRAHLSARHSSTNASAYTLHALTLNNGAVVREYARGDGTVFAVAWRGPSRPDLRQLLGPRFDVLQADNAAPAGRRTRRPLTVRRPDFIVSSGGHSGAFWGAAYLPGLAPAGFSPKDLS